MNIVLFQPEIAENVGSIIRTAACFDAKLHIIEPCGFPWVSKRIKAASMDYYDKVNIERYNSFHDFSCENKGIEMILMTTKAKKKINEYVFSNKSYLLFGNESSGVPNYIHDFCQKKAKIPISDNTRSLNLAVSVAISVYEAKFISNI